MAIYIAIAICIASILWVTRLAIKAAKNNPIQEMQETKMNKFEKLNNSNGAKIIAILAIVILFLSISNEKNETPTTREPTQEEIKGEMERRHIIKLGNTYVWNEIRNDKELIDITKTMTSHCKDDYCKIKKYYEYIKKIPYEIGIEGKDKNPIDVLVEGKGDCDEKTYLLASIMIANGYKALVIYTDQHALIALNIPNYKTMQQKAYIQYEGQKYYLAETTDIYGKIGDYNEESMKTFKYLYDPIKKKEINIDEITIHI